MTLTNLIVSLIVNKNCDLVNNRYLITETYIKVPPPYFITEFNK